MYCLQELPKARRAVLDAIAIATDTRLRLNVAVVTEGVLYCLAIVEE